MTLIFEYTIIKAKKEFLLYKQLQRLAATKAKCAERDIRENYVWHESVCKNKVYIILHK